MTASALAGVESLRTRDGYDWHSIRHHFDVRGFGVNANVAVEPGVIVEEHDETHGDGGQEELYVVLSGRATFTLEGEEVDAPPGTLVFVRDPAVKRAAVAHEAGTALLCLGGRPGQPFRISSWEYSRRALARAEAGDGDAAIAILEKALAERPRDPVLSYDLACFESLAGRREDALAHLKVALEADPSLVDHARTDTDLDPIRDDPSVPRPPGDPIGSGRQ
ncbi:MAG TPA: tetratricopeptide repeat protein [Gaiellaceae bacterium]|jgi:tetratricopeptide (TPR) repeat protein|nr:tetratricopeptide repeat protein [Gaiellaceae bacterium]